VETPDDRVEQDRARNRQIGAPRIHPRRRKALFEIGLAQMLTQAMQSFRAEAQVPQILGYFAIGGGHHQSEAEDRARCADDAIEPALDELVDVAPHLAIEVLDQSTLVAAAQRIAFDEPFGEADDADLEAAADRHVLGGAQRDLDAAAADVDDDGRRGADVDPVARGEVNEARLFGAGNHSDPDAGLTLDFADEVAAVVGF